jgi:uncharacterized membrane protein
MKKNWQAIVLMLLLAITDTTFAQVKTRTLENQYDDDMSSASLTARNHAVMIVNDTALKTAGKIKYADIVLNNLEVIKKAYESLKSSMSATKKESTKNLDTVIEKNNANAIMLAIGLKAELQKQKLDEAKLIDYSAKIVASIDEMEKAHQALK